MTTAIGSRSSQVAALLVVPNVKNLGLAVSQASGVVVYAPPSTRLARLSEAWASVPYEIGIFTLPRVSQAAAVVVYATGTPDIRRTRAWAFSLDGHQFYVLNLGQEGTFVYDTTTAQWAQFDTDGFGQWNMLNGTMWEQGRVVGGDAVTPQVWELVPGAVLDEGWRDIDHVVTGGVQLRSRVFVSCDALRIAASVGKIDEVNGATLSMRYSDDQGNTWSDYSEIVLTEGSFSAELAFRSLGSFASPGRIFELSDVGGLIRIDGADIYLDGFDGAPEIGQ